MLACHHPSLLVVPPNPSQVAARRRRLRLDEQSQRRLDHLALPRPVADGTDGAAHQVRRDKHARYPQPAGDMGEGPDEDRDGGDTLLFKGPADESDRPVTDRSSGDEQAGVDPFSAQPLGPLRRCLLTQPYL